MMPPKVVVFDLGKVLVEFDYGIMARKMAARGSLSAAEIQRIIDHSPLLFRYETGLMTKEQFYAEICSATGYRGDIREFAQVFADIFEPIPLMIEMHSQLRKRGFPTYIFSNTNELAVAHIRRSFPFFSNFDGYIFSFEHSAMKPQARLYEVVERETGRKGEEILYLDDRPENVAGGAARGWRVILQETPAKTRLALQAIGLLD